MGLSYSPLRYPGGKSQFYASVLSILSANNLFGCTYCEPFAGGAGVAIRLLVEHRVERIIINDFDRAVYAFWHAILNDTNRFIETLQKTTFDLSEWYRQKEIYLNEGSTLFELGFATFFLNRCNRSGIIKAGPIGGQNQNGVYRLDCRTNKAALMSKIQMIAVMRNRIVLENLDAETFIKKYSRLSDAFWFIDPPYYKKGSGLYANFYDAEGHASLSKTIAASLSDGKWILTYDDCKEVLALYQPLGYSAGRIVLSYSVQAKRRETEFIFWNNVTMPSEILYGQI